VKVKQAALPRNPGLSRRSSPRDTSQEMARFTVCGSSPVISATRSLPGRMLVPVRPLANVAMTIAT
jgi:hypothetical protein